MSLLSKTMCNSQYFHVNMPLQFDSYFYFFVPKGGMIKNRAGSLKLKPKILILLEDGNKEYGPLS